MSTTREEFGEFVASRGTAMLRSALLLSAGDRAAAEDLLQGALERSYRRWRRSAPDQPEAYVRRAMVNAAMNDRRRRDPVPVPDPPSRAVPDETQRVVVRDALFSALAALPPRQRVAVVLRYYDDLSEADTAAAMGCSPGTVKSQVSRGLDRLRGVLAPAFDETTVPE